MTLAPATHPPCPRPTPFTPRSKDRYRNQTQLLSVAHGYVDRQLPISVM